MLAEPSWENRKQRDRREKEIAIFVKQERENRKQGREGSSNSGLGGDAPVQKEVHRL